MKPSFEDQLIAYRAHRGKTQDYSLDTIVRNVEITGTKVKYPNHELMDNIRRNIEAHNAAFEFTFASTQEMINSAEVFWRLAKDIEPIEVQIVDILPRITHLFKHYTDQDMERVYSADLSYPIIIDKNFSVPDGYGIGSPENFNAYMIRDGYHRVLKALALGHKTIMAKVLPENWRKQYAPVRFDITAEAINENAKKPVVIPEGYKPKPYEFTVVAEGGLTWKRTHVIPMRIST